MTGLQEKVAIVTGGGTGIGRGIAIALAREGAKTVICGRRMDRLENTEIAIRELGYDCLSQKADVTVEGDVIRLIETTIEKYQRIDILINNAGVFSEAPLHELETSQWDRILDTNLRAPFLLVRHTLPIMRDQRSGHIINISSESGIEYYQNDSAYGTSKHALNDFGEYIQRENQEQDIRVNTICPGMVVTEMTQNSKGLNHEKCLYPEDIADLTVWLLTRRPNIKIGTPILIQTMQNPWE
jgi:NADP-dependent 3-hydroxy acid dehydrogenase YdfG